MTNEERFLPVKYNDALHQYSHPITGEVYVSATQLISHFHEPFDTAERTQYMEDRYGSTAEQWKKRWADHNRGALDKGTAKHDVLEQQNRAALMAKLGLVRHSDPTGPLKPRYYLEWADAAYPELLLWNHTYKIAGRADLPEFMTQRVNDGTGYKYVRVMDITDYKTNARIRRYSYNNLRMLAPLQHVMDCEYWHMALQLSIYQFMGEFLGFRPGKRTIIHYPPKIEGLEHLPEPDPVHISMPYMKREVVAMLEVYNELKQPA